MARLPPQHNEKREAALRANLLKRKQQARGRENDAQQTVENLEKTLNTTKPPAKD